MYKRQAFANTPIVCSPAYDIEAMMEKYPSPTATERTMQRDVVQTYEGRMRRPRVRLTKQSLVDRAVENGEMCIRDRVFSARAACSCSRTSCFSASACSLMVFNALSRALPGCSCRCV